MAATEIDNTVDKPTTMVPLNRLNGEVILVNAAHIVSIEMSPNTLLTLLNGQRLLVQQQPQVVSDLIRDWFQSVGNVNLLPLQGPHESGPDDPED